MNRFKSKNKVKDPLAPWSNAWLVTINTNSADRRLIKPLREIWDYILENAVGFTHLRPGGSLINIKEKSTIEIGPKYKRVHIHSALVIRSHGLCNLDFGYIKQTINDYLRPLMPTVNVFFSAKLIPNYNFSELIKEYIEKDPAE